jgi:hypothetical protein
MPSGFRWYTSPDNESGVVTGNSIDLGASLSDISVKIDITGTESFVIEGSTDDINFTIVSPVLIASTVWILSRMLQFYRVRVVSYVSGAIRAQWGAMEGRNREMGNVAPQMVTAGGNW